MSFCVAFILTNVINTKNKRIKLCCANRRALSPHSVVYACGNMGGCYANWCNRQGAGVRVPRLYKRGATFSRHKKVVTMKMRLERKAERVAVLQRLLRQDVIDREQRKLEEDHGECQTRTGVAVMNSVCCLSCQMSCLHMYRCGQGRTILCPSFERSKETWQTNGVL